MKARLAQSSSFGPITNAAVVIGNGPNLGTYSIGPVEIPLTATGGNGTDYVWSLFAGSLPPGFALRTDPPSCCFPPGATGLIGVATTPGVYNFTLRVTSGPDTADLVATLTVTALVNRENQLPDLFLGVPYSYQLTALGNAGPLTWTATGSLPTNVTLSTGGLLSGTPTSSGQFFPGITLFDGTDTINKGLNFTSFVVSIPTAGVLPNATQNSFYTTTVTAAGGAGGYFFSANGLPNGLSINSSSGVISGTPSSGSTSPGKFSVNVTARDSAFVSYSKSMSIDLLAPAATLPAIVPSGSGSSIKDCTLGQPCNRTISVQSGGSAPFTWIASGLPPGMDIRFGSGVTLSQVTPGDAELWGTPTVAGLYTPQFTVTDSLGATATNTFAMRVSELTATSFLPNGLIDTAYSQTVRVIGGTGPYTGVLTTGPLPVGITFTGATSLVSGTPTESGNFNPVFTFTDSASHVLLIDRTLNINSAGTGISINTSSNLGARTTGQSYSNQFSASGTVTWSVVAVGGESLPTGTTLSGGGLLSGTLTNSGVYNFTLKAVDNGNAANYAVRRFTLNVTPLSISTSTLPFGNVLSPYNQTLTATGGTGAVTWALNAGSYLPPGLSLAANGALTGTPTESGQYVFSATATDTTPNFRSNSFSLSIYPVGMSPPVSQTSGPAFGTFSIGQVETALIATGGDGTNYTWSLLSGTLPPGLSIRTDKPSFFPSNASAGLIGVATTPGPYSFTLRVSSGGSDFDLACTMKITALTLKDQNSLPDAFVGTTPAPYQLTALGAAGPVTFTPTSLPPGISLTAGGLLSGAPTAPGSPNINFTITDGTDTVSKSVFRQVFAVNITTPGLLPNATQNAAYNTTISATGGSGGHTFTASGLPSGLSISSGGLISGTVTASAGKTNVQVTARDSSFVSYTKNMSIDVIGVPAALPSLSVSSAGGLDDCTIGAACSRTISVLNGGAAPFTWTATGLPPGMGFRFGSGTTTSFITPGDLQLWGTPTATGTFNVVVKVTDADLKTAANTFPLKVVGLVETVFLSNGTIGVAYSQALRVLGGTGPYTAAVTAGQLPAGVTLHPTTFLVSGTPTENGFFNWVTTFTDSVGATLRITTNLTINNAPSTTANINSGANLGFITAGSPYSNQLSASGAVGTFTWAVTSGALPTGITLSGSGLLSGTPSGSGPSVFLVRVVDSANAGNTAHRQFTLNVTPISFTLNSTLPFGNVATPYNQTLTSTGGTNPVTWTLNAGSLLPPGLLLAANGVLSGTPTEMGQYRFTVTATDSVANTRSNTFNVSIYPTGTCGIIALSNTTFSNGPAGAAYSPTTITQTGGTAATTFAVTGGALPSGLSLSSTGTVSGTPTVLGTFPFTVTATDGSCSGSRGYSITIVCPTITLSATTFPDGPITVPYPATTITQTGGVGAATFAVTGGALPAGMSMSSAGTVSGTPSVSGTFSFTVTATDANGCMGSRGYSVTIAPNTPPTISSLLNRATPKNTPIIVNFTVGDTETAASALTVSGMSSNTVLVPVANIVFSGSGAARSATITPAAGQQGITTITLTVGDGALTANSAFLLRVGLTAGDLDIDGKSDLLWRNKSTGQNIGWLMNGFGVSTAAFMPTIGDTNWEIKGRGDFDGDGKADVLWRNKSTGQDIGWLMNGLTVSSAAFMPTIADTNWEVVGIGDFNGDGKADVILRNRVGGQNIGWLMNGLTVSIAAFLPTIADTNWEIRGVGDLDGDGKADVLWRNKSTGQDIGWLMNGLTVSFAAFMPTIADTNWEIRGLGDFDGDNRADVVLRNKSTGQDIGWLMNGLTVSLAAFLPTIADTNWEIKGTGDFDGNGKADILLRNKSTGHNIMWQMNGLTIESAAFIVQIADTNWEVVTP